VARVITSAEGRALSPLEVAEGYKRLIAYNWTPEQIAAKVGKTRQHVDQSLILANANSDVQAMVAGGSVSATSAIDAVRKHGEDAGKVLGGAVDAAKAAGKSKATSGAIKGKPLPRKLVSELEEILFEFAGTYSPNDRKPDAVVVDNLLEIIAEIRECRKKQAERGQSKAVKDAQIDIEQAGA
jgi:ParB-like chromosome segregation protein Spo0J